jgi:hypothetical protein
VLENPLLRHQLAVLTQPARLRRRVLGAMEGGPPLPPVTGDVGAIRNGDVGPATNPIELICEIGMRIMRQSPSAWTAAAGYTDGSVGYIPTRSAYPQGGLRGGARLPRQPGGGRHSGGNQPAPAAAAALSPH